MKRHRADPAFLDLTVSNITAVGLSPCAGYPRDLALPDAVRYDPHPTGSLEARSAVSAYYARRGLDVAPDHIVLAATTSEAYAFAFRLFAEVDDNVLAPSPSYPLFSFLGDLSDIAIRPYELRYDGRRWSLDVDALAQRVDERTRAVLTVCPNNPTGSLPGVEEQRHLVAWARRRSMPIISDEVFLDYLNEGHTPKDATFVAAGAPLVLSLSGLSKVAGLPQAKLAWIALSGDEALVAEARGRLEIMADTFLSVSTPIQLALPAILAGADEWQPALRARLAANLSALERATEGTPLRARPIDGGWHAIVDLAPSVDDEDWVLSLLERERVLVHPGYLFDIDGPPTIVVSLILPEHVFASGIARLAEHAVRGQ